MSSAAITLRELEAADAAAYREIRLEALQLVPEAFGSSFEEERDRTPAEFVATLETGYVVGAFAGEQLVGVAGFYAAARIKMAHRGTIWGVYVRPAFRGRGVARVLMEDVLDHAAQRVEQVHLSVVVGNAAALALYTRLGFGVYGTEPRALRIDGRDYDELLMVKRFERHA